MRVLGFKTEIKNNSGRCIVMTAETFLVIKTDYDFLGVQCSRGNQVYQEMSI